MGIPSEFIQQKKDEILKREEDNKVLEQMKLDKEGNDIDKSRDRGRPSPLLTNERQVSRSKSKSLSPPDLHKFSKSPEKQDKDARRNSTDKLKVQRKSVDSSDRSKERPSVRSPRPKSRARSPEKAKEQRQSRAPSKDRKDAKSKDRKKSSPDRSKDRSNDKPRDRKRSRSRRKSSGRSRDHRSRSRQRSVDKNRDAAKRRLSRSPRPRRRSRSRSVTPKSESRYRRSSPERHRDAKRMKSRSPQRQRKQRSPSEQNGTKSSPGDITKIQAKLINMAENNASKSTRSASPAPVDKPSLTKRDKSTSRSITK